MTDAPRVIPSGGWTVEHLDAPPESRYRHELTDGALTVAPSSSSPHQAVAMRLGVRLEALAPEPLIVTQAVEIRFGRQLTRVPDVLVVRSDQPGRHWFAPSEVLVAVEIESPGSHREDRATNPRCTPGMESRTTGGSSSTGRWSACTASGTVTATR
ncbi:MAG: Uma2 family endonuclease [Pseudonocardiales bacterium]|nr:Uma2 family endonuclease [Pseudonocardiales bacterium]MBV9029145.1 Uma2 family endonuclease [Pseudonocardiales bacterium]